MGRNAYFAYTLVKGMGLPWQTALGCVFSSGVAFLVLTIAGVRQLIVRAVPRPLFAAVAGGIRPLIAFIRPAPARPLLPPAGPMGGLRSPTPPPAPPAPLRPPLFPAPPARAARGAVP